MHSALGALLSDHPQSYRGTPKIHRNSARGGGGLGAAAVDLGGRKRGPDGGQAISNLARQDYTLCVPPSEDGGRGSVFLAPRFIRS